MSHWRQQMVDGADFWISCHWLAFLSSLSQWQLIQKYKKSARGRQHHKMKNPILKLLYLRYLSAPQGVTGVSKEPEGPKDQEHDLFLR